MIGLALVAACSGDPCEGGETECVDDHTIRRCNGTHDGFAVDYAWEESACYEVNPYCVTRADISANATPQAHGLCAAVPARVPSCAGTDGYCADGIRYRCTDGYAVAEERCASGCGPAGADCL